MNIHKTVAIAWVASLIASGPAVAGDPLRPEIDVIAPGPAVAHRPRLDGIACHSTPPIAWIDGKPLAPGDRLPRGGGRVERIECDRVTVHTGSGPQILRLPEAPVLHRRGR